MPRKRTTRSRATARRRPANRKHPSRTRRRATDPYIELLLDEVLRLPLDDRTLLARALVDSLQENGDEELDPELLAEIERRMLEVDEGRVRLEPWSEVRKRLFRR
jgi:putative addiction module component (TIGR02574 family)